MDAFQEDPVQKMNHSLYLKHPVVSQSQGDFVAGVSSGLLPTAPLALLSGDMLPHPLQPSVTAITQ